MILPAGRAPFFRLFSLFIIFQSTFYISHEWTDYSQVQDLYADGHEMASHTVTHSHGSGFDDNKWADEVVGMAEMLVRHAGVDPKDIKGMRAPFLQVGGDSMFRTLKRYGLYYDSSMSVTSPSWPYTLEYKIPHSCAVPPCPKESHPGKINTSSLGRGLFPNFF
jgi:peptidoglycan/xylan/chitin deacetylase (PgdA/CDA1 family)